MPPPDVTAFAPDWWQGSLSRFTGITSFLDAFIGVRIPAEEFAAMRQLNLRQIFIGMENAGDALLQWLRKPATAEHMLAAVRAAKAGGVRVGVILLVGAGGERFFDEHVRETVNVIRAMALGPGDYVYLSPLVAAHGAEYAQRAAAENIHPLVPARLAEQEQRMRQGIRVTPAARDRMWRTTKWRTSCTEGGSRLYFTSSGMLSEWLLNSGAYMHWIAATPVWYWPAKLRRGWSTRRRRCPWAGSR